MKKYFTYSLLAILLLTLLVYPSFAWFYNDFPEPGKAADTKFEMFGPRCDRLLIKLYSTASGEWEALKATPQELDVTDTPLDYNYYNQFIQPPYDATVNVESVGGEFGIRNLDMNQNNNPYLGAPQNSLYPNPVKNIGGQAVENPTSDLNFRKAILSCIDRSYYVANIIGSGFAVEHWSMLPPATGMQYYSETFRMYPFSLINAAAYLAAGNFKLHDGYIYWDLNDDDVEQANEYVELHFVIRNDDPHRNAIGIHLSDQLNAIHIRVWRDFLDITGARATWMLAKNAHLYTAGWSLGIEPDSIVLWMGDAGVGADLSYYWHPGTCYNTAYANDPTFNINARIVEIANSEAEAITAMDICNTRAAEMALNGPMFVYSSTMANARTYAGGTPAEEDYVDRLWKGMVMVTGYGSDSFFGMLNMHPEGYPLPADGVIRYGFATTAIGSFNSLYADVLWDNKILDLTYDSLVKANPYELYTRLPWLCKQYTVSSYEHPTLGTCTKVWVTLRNDVQWSDGTPVTTADVYFTLVESWRLLQARGLPNPWWYSAVKSILSFEILDPLNFEILINVKSIWAFGLTGATVRIMPEHIWRPIITSGTPTQIQGATPDVNMISSGAWRIREYIATAYVDLVANKPGRTVKTSFAGNVPITSPKGFFRYYPKYVDIHADNYKSKIFLANPSDPSVDVNLTVTDHNLLADQFDFALPLGPHPGSPVGDPLIFEPYGCQWVITDWIDGNAPDFPPDGMLSVCDMIQIQGIAPATPPVWVHVQSFPAPNVIHVGQVIEALKTVYVDDVPLPGSWPVHEYEKPCHPIIEEFTVNLARGFHVAKVVKTITTEWMLQQDNTVVPFPWITTITVTWPIWVTIKEDITGSYYINPNLPAPDIKVDSRDVSEAQNAFGSIPGDERWSPIADINQDYEIDMIDIDRIANFYGWPDGGQPLPDIAVNGVSCSKSVVCQGYALRINVTVQNEVEYSISFNLTTYANSSSTTTQQITLDPYETRILEISWNTSGFAKGNYTIWAYAWPVPGETDTTDNTLIGATVLVTIPGDVNGDKKVRVDDVLAVALRFGTDYGGPPNSQGYVYDANCDINDDGKIRVDDVLTAALNFGQGPWT